MFCPGAKVCTDRTLHVKRPRSSHRSDEQVSWTYLCGVAVCTTLRDPVVTLGLQQTPEPRPQDDSTKRNRADVLRPGIPAPIYLDAIPGKPSPPLRPDDKASRENTLD
eukprot:353000-Chlamydomonas_euryale.AAC.10